MIGQPIDKPVSRFGAEHTPPWKRGAGYWTVYLNKNDGFGRFLKSGGPDGPPLEKGHGGGGGVRGGTWPPAKVIQPAMGFWAHF